MRYPNAALSTSGILSWLLAVCLTACGGPDVVYEHHEELGEAGWDYGDSVRFAFDVTDTTARYDLVLLPEHTTDFPYQNFYVRVTTHLPDGRRLQQPLSLQLANKYGEWYGECGSGRCTNAIALQENARFTATGEHRIVVEQYSREKNLEAVTGLGFRLLRRAVAE